MPPRFPACVDVTDVIFSRNAANNLHTTDIGSHDDTPRCRRPEAELLLGCARSRIQPRAAQRVRQALKEKIDWDHIIEEVFNHGTAPLLFWNLSRLDLDGIPKATLDQLKNACKAIAQRNLSLTGELLRLLNLFRESGIRALPVKGPALAATVYGNVSLRYFGDLDILMSRDDILKAKDLLQQHGYQPKLDLTASQEIEYLRSHHDYQFVRTVDGTVVDLQWGITQWSFAFPFDFTEMWKSREVSSLAGASVFNLSSATLLLVLCVHGTKHRWEQLKWICDIAELVDISRDKIDWYRLIDQARAKGGERMLLLGLFLAHDLLGAHLPKEVMERIRNDSTVKVLADKVSGRLFRKVSRSDRLGNDRPFFFWQVRERLRDKLAIAWRYFPEYFLMIVVPNKKDHALVQLPKSLSMVYYLLRPVRLAWQLWTKCQHHSGRVEK
jgi:hypothetical protein